MKTTISILRTAKLVRDTLLMFIFSIVSLTVYGQVYTTNDSVTFAQSLQSATTDFDRIKYQLNLADYAMKKANSTKADSNAARIWVSKSEKLNAKLKSDEVLGHILLEKCFLAERPERTLASMADLKKAIGLLKNAKDKCLLAEARLLLSNYYSRDDIQQMPQKIELIKQSIDVFKGCGNQMRAAATLQKIAELYLTIGNFSLATKSAREAISIYESVRYQKTQVLYDLLGLLAYVKADYENALSYEYKALKIAEQDKDTSLQAGNINSHLGNVLTRSGHPEKAIPYFKKALIIDKKNPDVNAILMVALNGSSAYMDMNDPKSALDMMDENTKAFPPVDEEAFITIDQTYIIILVRLKAYKRAQSYVNDILKRINSPSIGNFDRSKCYHALSIYYFAVKDFQKQEEILQKNQQLVNALKVPFYKEQNLKSWYELDSARKDYTHGFWHLLNYKNLEDSVFSEKKSQQIQQLQVRFDTKRKEDDLKILTQNEKIDKAQLKSAQFTRNVTMAGIAVLILFVGVFYWRYREKKKINTVITGQNAELQLLIKEKEWLLKEVHHRVKNNLHTVICLLDSQALYLQDDALKAIENSKHRIYAMSLIHQKLYQSDDIKVIDMDKYLSEFLNYLEESFGSPEHIKLNFKAQTFQLAAAQAIPVGLIINETVTNAYKYAFPNNRQGEIRVLLNLNEEEVFLSVSDNGIGFQPPPDNEINSLGTELIKGLALDLRGELNFKREMGTTLELRFKIDRYIMSAEDDLGYLVKAV